MYDFICFQIQQLLADMRDIYSRNRVCPYVKPPKNTSLPIRPESIKCNLALDPGTLYFIAFSQLTESSFGMVVFRFDAYNGQIKRYQ